MFLLSMKYCIKQRKKRQTGGILKLDFEKPYDKVNWYFLICAQEQEVLMRSGVLGLRWYCKMALWQLKLIIRWAIFSKSQGG
jgi:hypothetical protein